MDSKQTIVYVFAFNYNIPGNNLLFNDLYITCLFLRINYNCIIKNDRGLFMGYKTTDDLMQHLRDSGIAINGCHLSHMMKFMLQSNMIQI